MNKPNPTKLEIATAIRKAVKRRKWGDADGCPLCNLFCYRIYDRTFHDCKSCSDAVFGGKSCCAFIPTGTDYTAEEYWYYEIPDNQRASWRRAANRELLKVADRLEREHEAENRK